MSKHLHWVLGHHAVDALLSVNPERATALYAVLNPNSAVQRAILNKASSIGLTLHTVDKHELSKRCNSEQHQGIAVQAQPKQDGGDQELQTFIGQLTQTKTPLLLILDQVQDPHNLGACLRTADAAGVDALIVAKDNTSPVTAVVQKVASGAAETMPVYRVSNLARAMDSLKQQGIWMIGTSDKADHSLYQENLAGAIALVMGSEGKGLRSLTEKKCDALVSLPMSGKVVSSLNVSVATGVCLYEVVRQRGVL